MLPRNHIPRSLHSDLYKFVPISTLSKCVCCVIYDEHPRDEKKIDITICSEQGLVQEFYQMELISSLLLPSGCNFKEIKILRNNQGKLYYLIASENDLFIVSSTKDNLSVHRYVSDVQHYEVCDPQCTGEAMLKIVINNNNNSHTIHLSSANDLEIINNEVSDSLEDVKPVIRYLETKLNEAKYNLQNSQNVYQKILDLRQWITYSSLEGDAEQIETPKPRVRFCNKKIVIQLELKNPYDESIRKVSVLIHNNSCKSLSYTSKLYMKLPSCPFYNEIENQEVTGKCKSSVLVAVICLKEFQSSIRSAIEFNIVLSYQRQGKDYIQPFGNVNISASDVMGSNFDVFSSPEIDDHCFILDMLSTTEPTTLCLKEVFDPAQQVPRVSLENIFLDYLDMESLKCEKKVVIHRRSPHHILHGMMIIFNDENKIDCIRESEFSYTVNVYAKSPAQVLALIHFIYHKVPHTIIVTTPHITYSNEYNMPVGNTELGASLRKQTSMTIKYLDDCLMNTKPSGSQKIDVFAMGIQKFEEYRNNMLSEAENFVEQFVKEDKQINFSTRMEGMGEKNLDYMDID